MYNYRVYNMTVPADLVDERLEGEAEKVILLDADRTVYFKLDSTENDAIPLEKGQIITLNQSFSKLFLSVTAGANIIFMVSKPGGLSIEGNNVNVTGSVIVSKSGKTDTASHAKVGVTNSAAVCAASNVDRQSLTVKNIDSSLDAYLGFANTVTTANGFKLAPGESITFDHYTGAVYCIAAATSNLSVISEG